MGLLAVQWKVGLKLSVVSISKLHNVDMVYIAFGGLLKATVSSALQTHASWHKTPAFCWEQTDCKNIVGPQTPLHSFQTKRFEECEPEGGECPDSLPQ